MRRKLVLVVLIALRGVVACSGGGSGDDSSPTAAAPCGTAEGSGVLPEAGAGDEAGTASAKMRVFNFVGPLVEASAIDVCLQPAGSAADAPWSGPIYRNTHTYPKYGSAAPYLDIAPGLYRVRVVPWGASECEATLSGAQNDVDLVTSFDMGTYRTLVLSAWLIDGKDGVPQMPLAARVLDDAPDFAAHKLSVRFLDMDPQAGGLDVWKAAKNAAPSTWQPVMTNIPFGEVGVATAASPFGATDPRGYLLQSPADWPVSIMYNVALCPHGSTTSCYQPGGQSVEGNVTLFASRTAANSWKFNWVSDGSKLFDPMQQHMVPEGADRWW
ncbi:MAG: hypothetical protein JWO86_8531 [Myxococcaceae bacterium]|nr:hypothetical protein [Myxococcaceae bacterium]